MPETTLDRLMVRSREAMRDSREPSDDDLIGRFYNGDAEAFRALDELYRKRLLGYFLLRARNFAIAEELTQETFLKVIKTDAKYQPGSNGFAAWLFSIARGVLIDHFRRHGPGDAAPIEEDTKKEDPEHGESHSVVIVTPDSPVGEVFLARELLTSVLNQLSKDCAAAFLLRFYLGLTAEEAGRVLGKTANAVDQSIHRAKGDIRKSKSFRSIAEAFDVVSARAVRHAIHELLEDLSSEANRILTEEQRQRLLLLIGQDRRRGNER